jgi:hypothetical protein
MERDHINNQETLLIPVNGAELPDLCDAIVAHSELLDQAGDHLGAIRLKSIVDTISCLQGIEIDTSRQMLLALGLGAAKGRPQG